MRSGSYNGSAKPFQSRRPKQTDTSHTWEREGGAQLFQRRLAAGVGGFLCAQLLCAPLPELAQHRRNSQNPAGCIMLVGIPISKRKTSQLCTWLKQHLVPETQDWVGRLEAQQAGLVCTDRSPSDPPVAQVQCLEVKRV